jgi:hypothetical protein
MDAAPVSPHTGMNSQGQILGSVNDTRRSYRPGELGSTGSAAARVGRMTACCRVPVFEMIRESDRSCCQRSTPAEQVRREGIGVPILWHL